MQKISITIMMIAISPLAWSQGTFRYGPDERAGEWNLAIEAIYLIDPEAPYELPVKRWTEALRADPVFGRGLKRIDLETSSQKIQGKAEVYTFTLAAEWEH